MEIDTPEMNEADILADLWVELARDQFEHGSHLAAEDNRTAIYESICQHIVTGGVLVARVSDFNPDTSVELKNSSYSETDIVGFVMFTTKSGQYDEIVSAGAIENIYVVEDLREGGIGSALLTAAEDALKTDGIEIITLDVMATNKSARRFYARHGYDAHRVTMSKDETDTHSKGE
jgi:ribosomal protein S18 acetylase RimI-like enzyme